MYENRFVLSDYRSDEKLSMNSSFYEPILHAVVRVIKTRYSAIATARCVCFVCIFVMRMSTFV